MPASVEKKLVVGKTDDYFYPVDPSWLNGNTISSRTITPPSNVTLVEHAVSQAGVIRMRLTGVSAGGDLIHIEWVTSDGRSDCAKATIVVIEDCV